MLRVILLINCNIITRNYCLNKTTDFCCSVSFVIQYKLSQYGDDTLFLLDGTSKLFNETPNVLSEFSRFSGLKVKVEYGITYSNKNNCLDKFESKWSKYREL